MIIKVGTDIIEVERVKYSIENFGDKFLNRIFTKNEIEYCNKNSDTKYQSLAARFAAKEAVYKAISEYVDGSLIWKNIEVKNTKSGRPIVILHGDENTKISNIDISLSHIKNAAIATVVVTID